MVTQPHSRSPGAVAVLLLLGQSVALNDHGASRHLRQLQQHPENEAPSRHSGLMPITAQADVSGVNLLRQRVAKVVAQLPEKAQMYLNMANESLLDALTRNTTGDNPYVERLKQASSVSDIEAELNEYLESLNVGGPTGSGPLSLNDEDWAHVDGSVWQDALGETPSAGKETFQPKKKNWPKCGTSRSDGITRHVEDMEGNERCFSAVVPDVGKGPLPVLFWFHASGGCAYDCGMSHPDEMGYLAEYAKSFGFALVCPEALQDIYAEGGQWAIPEKTTKETGTKCWKGRKDPSQGVDMGYMHNVLQILSREPNKFDLDRIYTFGLSMGGAFSEYVGVCLSEQLPEGALRAFATYSTGLKIKDDGLHFPADIYNPQWAWSQCPDCGYWPILPKKMPRGLKACIFDNFEDPSDKDPFFMKSSKQLYHKWREVGNRAEAHWLSGGHMDLHSFRQVLMCLDDGTGRLFTGERLMNVKLDPKAPGLGESNMTAAERRKLYGVQYLKRGRPPPPGIRGSAQEG